MLADVPDSIAPPVLLLLWRDDPWLEPQPNARGTTFRAQLQVLAVAGRIDPAPGIELLEELVGYVAGRMHSDGYGWGLPTVTAPRQEPIGGVNYLAAAITYRVAVTTEEE